MNKTNKHVLMDMGNTMESSDQFAKKATGLIIL